MTVRGSGTAEGADEACPGGFVAVEPRGYVCLNDDVTTDPDDAAVAALAELLPRGDGLPFRYGRARSAQHFHWLPNDAQLRLHVPAHRRDPEAQGDTQSPLAGYLRSPRPGLPVRADVYDGRQVAWAREVVLDGRRWLVTPWPSLVPADRVEGVDAPPAAGRPLALDETLALAFVNGRPFGPVRRWLPAGWGFVPAEPLPTWTLVPLADPPGDRLGMVQLADGAYVRSAAVSAFRRDAPPPGLAPGAKWVQVHLGAETLVAYEGERPVYVAAVSTGAHGAMGQHRTALGSFRVTTKWRTQTMGGTGADGTSYRSPEVPFVAYYDGARALHGAWWHDWFGHPRSHGCVNLAPDDAQWLFAWLDPVIPEGWYAVEAGAGEGTTVVVAR